MIFMGVGIFTFLLFILFFNLFHILKMFIYTKKKKKKMLWGKIISLIYCSSLSTLPLKVCTATLWVHQSISSLDERHQLSSIAATQIVPIIYAPPFLQNIVFSVLFNWLN